MNCQSENLKYQLILLHLLISGSHIFERRVFAKRFGLFCLIVKLGEGCYPLCRRMYYEMFSSVVRLHFYISSDYC